MTKIKNVLIRNLSDDDREAIQIAMNETGKHQASQALLTICRGYARVVSQLKKANKENACLKEQNRQLRNCTEIILTVSEKLKEVYTPKY